jgi:DNA-binding transcriptional MerR regulator
VRIDELAEASGTTTKTLRFYETAGLLPPPERTLNGYRDYAPEILARLNFVRRSRTAGLTLAQIRKVLDIRDAGAAPCTHVHDLLETRLGDLDRQIAELQALRHTVAHLHAGAATIDPANCDATTLCHYL